MKNTLHVRASRSVSIGVQKLVVLEYGDYSMALTLTALDALVVGLNQAREYLTTSPLDFDWQVDLTR